MRSREKDDELQRSTKKGKENHNLGPHHTIPDSSSEEGSKSYKEKLLGEILGAFEQAFDFGLNMELEADSDEEFSDLLAGEKAIKFLGTMKVKIRTPWANALIVKVFGKTVGFHFLHARILGLWKPIGRMVVLILEMTSSLSGSKTERTMPRCSGRDHGSWEAITFLLGARSQILSRPQPTCLLWQCGYGYSSCLSSTMNHRC